MLLYLHNLMLPPSYMRPVVDRNVVLLRYLASSTFPITHDFSLCHRTVTAYRMTLILCRLAVQQLRWRNWKLILSLRFSPAMIGCWTRKDLHFTDRCIEECARVAWQVIRL